MGKHSKPRKKSRTPLWATALLPVGVLAGAATAGAELSGNTLAPTPVSAPQVTSEAPTTPPSVTPAVKAHPLAPTPPPPPVRPASVTTGAVPVTNYDAYEAAAKSVTSTHPRCGIDWKVIAGIGRVESHHADQGNVNPDGVLRSAIFGPRLDGSLAGNQVIGDTDGGELDGARILAEETVELALRDHLDGAPLPKESISTVPELSNTVALLDVPQGWGLGFHLYLTDLPGMRSAGSADWSGLFNSFYWIDRTAGVAAVIATQVLPFFDEAMVATILGFEAAVYAQLSAASNP